MLAEDGAQKKVSTAFLCLKTLKLSDVDFTCDIMSSFVTEMICGSQNLQTLEIKVSEMYMYQFNHIKILLFCIWMLFNPAGYNRPISPIFKTLFFRIRLQQYWAAAAAECGAWWFRGLREWSIFDKVYPW